MTDLSPSPQRIQVEETAYRGPVSENLASRLGGSINELLDAIMPVGAVMSAFLTEAQFQTLVSPRWVLADGRPSTGSVFQTLTGLTTVPDLRGVVLRGKDNGRGLNPDGNLALGQYQGDQFGSHAHTLHASGTGSNGTTDVSGGHDHYNSDPRFFSISMDAAGGNETRAKNVTVNHFVKIN